MQHKQHARRRQQQSGAILVESVIVCSSFILMLGLLVFVHHLGTVRIHTFQQTHSLAWRKAMDGCPSLANLQVAGLLLDLEKGQPPSDVFGVRVASEEGSIAIEGLARQTILVKQDVMIPCQSAPPRPEGDVIGLVTQLFDPK